MCVNAFYGLLVQNCTYPGRGVCSLLRAKGFKYVGSCLGLTVRLSWQFQRHGSVDGKNGARFEINFVFSEGLCLNKWTSPKISCSERTAHHPSWHMVRHIGVCLSFQQILARFLKCSPQMTGQSIYIIQYCTWTWRWEINSSKRLPEALRSHENSAKHTRWTFSDFVVLFIGFRRNIV